MKTIKVRPVLLPTKDKHSQLEIDDIPIGKLSYEAKHYHCKHPQELILISLEDEKIEYKDTVYEPDNEIQVYELGELYKDGVPESYPWYKVIALQSQIPPEYISKFIEQYNNGCVEDLEIEGLGKMLYDTPDVKIIHNKGTLFELNSETEIIPHKIVPKLTNGFVSIVEK